MCFLPKSDDTFPVRELNTELLNFEKLLAPPALERVSTLL